MIFKTNLQRLDNFQSIVTRDPRHMIRDMLNSSGACVQDCNDSEPTNSSLAVTLAPAEQHTECTFLSYEEQRFLGDAKFWLEGVIQVTIFRSVKYVLTSTFSRLQLSFAVLGVITNLVSIYVLSRKELVNTFNQERLNFLSK